MPLQLSQELIAVLIEDVDRDERVEWTDCQLVTLVWEADAADCLQVLGDYWLLLGVRLNVYGFVPLLDIGGRWFPHGDGFVLTDWC